VKWDGPHNPERFPEKWKPVFGQKARQSKRLNWLSVSESAIEQESASAPPVAAAISSAMKEEKPC
jgi:hypothetical protein